jgi:GNAT superfamily N-acetyltransferase
MLLIRPATVEDAPLIYRMIRELAELYLEDLYVRPKYRRKGIGMALLSEVARSAMRWEVLDWNRDAIALYKALGAEFRDQWKSVALGGAAMRRLAERTL